MVWPALSTVDGAAKVLPLAFDLDVRLVHRPAAAYWTLLPFPESSIQLGRELLNPAVDVRMLDPAPRSSIISFMFR